MARLGGLLYQETIITASPTQPSFGSPHPIKADICNDIQDTFAAADDGSTAAELVASTGRPLNPIHTFSSDILSKGAMGDTDANEVSTFARQIQRVLEDDGFAYETAFCPEDVLRLARKYQKALNGRSKVEASHLSQQNSLDILVKPENCGGGFKGNENNSLSLCETRPSTFTSALLGMANSGVVRKSSGSQSGEDTAKPKPTFVMRSPSAIKEALLRWCQIKTKGYSNVNITNFSSSWANGMAFCALIHHFCPDAFDFNSLDPNRRSENLALAFKVAEEHAGIVPLLEVEDMLMMGDRPDYKCIFTYVQSFYRQFRDCD